MKVSFSQFSYNSKSLFRAAFLASALLVASPILPPGATLAPANAVVGENGSRASFQAIQQQVETIRPDLTRSTVAIYAGDGTGSGVIVSSDGLVMTAGHVISGQQGQRMRVILEDGRSLPATFLGADRKSDLGLIQIEGAKNLPVAPLGDSATLRPGQWVTAIGHPLGRRPGRSPVLRLGRVFGAPEAGRSDFEKRRIATDASLLNGDSGGPLYDLNGRVVGIHSMITSARGFSASIHIPINLGKAAVERVRAGGAPLTWDGPSSPFTAALRTGQEAFLNGDIKGAIRSTRKAADIDPTSAMAHLLLARSLARGGEQANAVVALRDALKGGFNDIEEIRNDAHLGSLLREPTVARLVERIGVLNGIPGARKTDRYFRTASQEVATHTERGIVRIRAAGKEVALGTILSADGDVFSKASELPDGPLECVLPDGTVTSAERIADDADWDVALLKVEASDLEPVALTENILVGRWTFSPDATESPATVGVVGVSDMPVRSRGIAPRPTSKAYMGIRLEPVATDTLRTVGLAQGVRVEVEEDLPAAKAGLQNGDIIFEADGKPIKSPDGFMDMMVGKQPGDTLKVRVARGEQRVEATIDLISRPRGIPGRGGYLEMVSGEVSRMSGPFPRVLHHDTVLLPVQMGGPLLDLEGRCIGINIARADRTTTYAIRADDVKRIYRRLKQ